jgi:hypothetical protein
MAQTTTVMLIDDLDGTQADETVHFSLDGAFYEIDLSADHATTLRNRLAGFAQSARRISRRATRPTGRAAARRRAGKAGATLPEEGAAIREWARARGYTVSDRGRLATDVIDAYRRAR